MPIPGDRRAWDARVVIDGRRAGCEVEMQLLDLQALERRLALKLRDGDVDILLLVVAEHGSQSDVPPPAPGAAPGAAATRHARGPREFPGRIASERERDHCPVALAWRAARCPWNARGSLQHAERPSQGLNPMPGTPSVPRASLVGSVVERHTFHEAAKSIAATRAVQRTGAETSSVRRGQRRRQRPWNARGSLQRSARVSIPGAHRSERLAFHGVRRTGTSELAPDVPERRPRRRSEAGEVPRGAAERRARRSYGPAPRRSRPRAERPSQPSCPGRAA